MSANPDPPEWAERIARALFWMGVGYIGVQILLGFTR